jgi:CelD/BcsL family acetyltransferase involved in cellulose biosynthesis
MTKPFKSDAFDVVATPHLREVTTLAGIDGLRDAWQALERRHRGELAYFQTFDWCRNWVAHIAASLPGVSPRIICVWKGAHLVALMPAMMSRVAGGVRMLKALGEPHTQYAGMLTDPAGFCPETVQPAEAVSSASPAVVMRYRFRPGAGSFPARIRDAAQGPGEGLRQPVQQP